MNFVAISDALSAPVQSGRCEASNLLGLLLTSSLRRRSRWYSSLCMTIADVAIAAGSARQRYPFFLPPFGTGFGFSFFGFRFSRLLRCSLLAMTVRSAYKLPTR
jgi:hypothetical protein